MKQKAFHFKGYARHVADEINDLIHQGWRIVSMTSITPISESNQMHAVVVAEKPE